MYKYKSHNLIEVWFDFLKTPNQANGHILSQYEKEAKEWEKNPNMLRCPKCKSRDLNIQIFNKFKDIPEYKLWCATCGWRQTEPFASISTFADISYPKSKWEEKYQQFYLKYKEKRENLK
jgi:hypothetical protein